MALLPTPRSLLRWVFHTLGGLVMLWWAVSILLDGSRPISDATTLRARSGCFFVERSAGPAAIVGAVAPREAHVKLIEHPLSDWQWWFSHSSGPLGDSYFVPMWVPGAALILIGLGLGRRKPAPADE